MWLRFAWKQRCVMCWCVCVVQSKMVKCARGNVRQRAAGARPTRSVCRVPTSASTTSAACRRVVLYRTSTSQARRHVHDVIPSAADAPMRSVYIPIRCGYDAIHCIYVRPKADEYPALSATRNQTKRVMKKLKPKKRDS